MGVWSDAKLQNIGKGLCIMIIGYDYNSYEIFIRASY